MQAARDRRRVPPHPLLANDDGADETVEGRDEARPQPHRLCGSGKRGAGTLLLRWRAADVERVGVLAGEAAQEPLRVPALGVQAGAGPAAVLRADAVHGRRGVEAPPAVVAHAPAPRRRAAEVGGRRAVL